MRRVYFVYVLRRVFNPTMRKLYGMVLCAIFGSFFFSFKNVLANMFAMSGVSSLYNFYLSAFLNTSFIVQVIFVVVSVLGIMVVKDVIRGVRKLASAQNQTPIKVRF